MAKYKNISASPVTVTGKSGKVRVLPQESKTLPDGAEWYIQALVKEGKLEKAGNATKEGESENPSFFGMTTKPNNNDEE